jgi:type III restriction enzyme
MELKPYQQQVLNDLDEYLNYIQKEQQFDKAFNNYWEDKIGPYNPLEGKGMEPYKNDIPKVPHVCIKVPTAGGKTFIASNAIEVIYRYYKDEISKVVVWLVPSVTILEQTIRNLSDPVHPYRQRINTQFNSRVEVYKKDDLLQGTGFNPTSVKEQLSILVLSFDSLRTKKKEDRKFYQENGQLSPFTYGDKNSEHVLDGTDETALINVIRKLKPVVIVDEAHGAVTDLSVEMLKNLNPSFVLDLTATPRQNSNIISFVDAFALKKENMVKLPVIVYNHKDRSGVIESAINLQKKLEIEAKKEETNSGVYIRPIVLFQAQSRTAEDNTTFEKIKNILLQLSIPENQIKIKTAEINEIKDVDLLAKDCEVRYIITVNALKEGWDCPFAYILASLADKSSVVDVEQILGRILRQPYVKKHKFDLLNCSFVLTASAKFMDTLENIVKGLNKAGFSKHDYKVALDEIQTTQQENKKNDGVQVTINEDIEQEVKIETIIIPGNPAEIVSEVLKEIEIKAGEASEDLNRLVEKKAEDILMSLPLEIQNKVKVYNMKEVFAEKAKGIRLPQFYLKVPSSPLMLDDDENFVLLSKDILLEDFKLSREDNKINFDNVHSELYKVDLEKIKGDDYTPTFSQFEDKIKEPLVAYILTQPKESQIEQLTGKLVKLIGNLWPIPDKEINLYVKRVVESFTPEQIMDVIYHELSYRDKIKDKIRERSEIYAEEQFSIKLDSEAVVIKETFSLPERIVPVKLAPSIAKSLYEAEGEINLFEEKVINTIANCSNIEFWHRNPERKGFHLNGFINHYPDFIIYTKSRKIIVIESKGDYLDGKDSKMKIRLGQKWADKAGSKYKYFMVFEQKQVEGAYKLEDVINVIKNL